MIYDTQYLLRALVIVVGMSIPLSAQGPAGTSQATTAARPQHRYTLNVASRLGFIDIALKAENARLSDIAADLSKRLGARVVLGPSIRQQMVSVSFPQSALEPALAALAPRVFVDYEIRQDAGAAPMEIHLLGASDPAPPMSSGAPAASQGVLIAGHTEEAPGSPADDPLRIAADKNGVMITAKKQPLSLVAIALADALGVPLELKYDAAEPVDVDIKYYAPLEDVIPSLSPNLRLHLRVDVTGQQRSPLKLILERRTAK